MPIPGQTKAIYISFSGGRQDKRLIQKKINSVGQFSQAPVRESNFHILRAPLARKLQFSQSRTRPSKAAVPCRLRAPRLSRGGTPPRSCSKDEVKPLLLVKNFAGQRPASRSQQFSIWPGTRETARSEIAPYPEITAKRGVYEVGRALRARRCKQDRPYCELLPACCQSVRSCEKIDRREIRVYEYV